MLENHVLFFATQTFFSRLSTYPPSIWRKRRNPLVTFRGWLPSVVVYFEILNWTLRSALWVEQSRQKDRIDKEVPRGFWKV